MSALLELAERCEKAKGPDLELDCLIYCATAESHFEYHGGDMVLAVQGGFSARLDWKDLPHPTASLDAAMTLVPEGRSFILSSKDTRYHLGESAYTNTAFAFAEDWSRHSGCGETPALALTAAALRALASSAYTPQSTSSILWGGL